MIEIICSKCGHKILPSQNIRFSDQFHICVEPCTCISKAVFDALDEKEVMEKIFIPIDYSESHIKDEHEIASFKDLESNLSAAITEIREANDHSRNLKRKNKKLKDEIKNLKLKIKKIGDKRAKEGLNIAEWIRKHDGLEIMNKKLKLEIEELKYKCRTYKSKIEGKKYSRIIDI